MTPVIMNVSSTSYSSFLPTVMTPTVTSTVFTSAAGTVFCPGGIAGVSAPTMAVSAGHVPAAGMVPPSRDL